MMLRLETALPLIRLARLLEVARCPFLRINLSPPPPLFWAPARQHQGFFIVFLLIEDGRDIEVRLVAKMHIVRALCALQPLCELLLRKFLSHSHVERGACEDV